MKQFLRNIFRSVAMDIVVLVLIIASIVLLAIEAATDHPIAELLGHVITGIFIVELSLRFWIAPSKRSYFREYWIDIIAVMPVLRAFRVLRVLRLLRLFRAGLVVGRRAASFRAMMESNIAEYLIVLSVVVMIILFGTMARIWGAEKDEEVSFKNSLFSTMHTLIAGEPIDDLKYKTKKGEEKQFKPFKWQHHLITLVISVGGMVTFALLTGVVTSYMVERLRARLRVQDMDISELREHVIICGFNRTAPRIIMELRSHKREARRAIVIISEADPTEMLDHFKIRRDNIYHIKDDFTRVDVLRKARVSEVAKVIVVADDSVERSDQDRDARSILAALTVERINPKAYTCVELLSADNAPHLAVAGIEEVVVPADFGGHLLGEIAMYRGLMPVVQDIFSRGKGQDLHLMGVPPEFVGKPFREMYLGLKERWDAVPIAVISYDHEKHHVMTNPPLDTVLKGDEAIVVIAAAEKEEPLSAYPPPKASRVG